MGTIGPSVPLKKVDIWFSRKETGAKSVAMART